MREHQRFVETATPQAPGAPPRHAAADERRVDGVMPVVLRDLLHPDGVVDPTPDGVRRLEDKGVTDVIVGFRNVYDPSGGDMTLEQLRIFVAVAEREHVTRAARDLHLTQSATSAAVTALEARYATKLFDRVGRGIMLTDVGRVFLAEARAVLARAVLALAALAWAALQAVWADRPGCDSRQRATRRWQQRRHLLWGKRSADRPERGVRPDLEEGLRHRA